MRKKEKIALIHFAYPNIVRKDTFSGCGRLVAALQSPGEEYNHFIPNVHNLTEINHAVRQLAPEASDSQQLIYQKKDSQDNYAGESMDFAYVLAQISRTRSLVVNEKNIQGDIWCTGSIDIKDGSPFLKAVQPRSFEYKLQAFLSKHITDRIFLVPVDNLLTSYKPLLHASDVREVSVPQLQDHSLLQLDAGKTIVKLQPDELPLLVQTLFESPQPPPRTENPYRGLSTFRQEDAEVFFGRDKYCEQLLKAVRHKPFVTVVGNSGSGKSSLVYAGLLPRLEEEEWVVECFRPGRDPLWAIASALTHLLSPQLNQTEHLEESDSLRKRLNRQETSLTKLFQNTLPHPPILLFIDQFEELFSMCDDAKTRRKFLKTLVGDIELLNDFNITIVVTLRADFLNKALSYRSFSDAYQDRSLALGPMSREELHAVIEQPAHVCGLECESGLAERILEAIGEEPGYLPLLEFTLTELWKRRKDGTLTHDAYDAVGGVKEALAQSAEEVYSQLTAQEQKQARQIFGRLVDIGQGTGAIRKVATRLDLGEQNWSLIMTLARTRLVVTGSQEAIGTSIVRTEEIVELVHESLIEGWPRLKNWLAEDREFLLCREDVQASLNSSQDDSTHILQGKQLQNASRFFKERKDDFSGSEKDHIRRSLHAEHSRKVRSWMFTPILALGLTLLVLLLVFLLLQFNFIR